MTVCASSTTFSSNKDDVVWADLLNPTKEEEAAIESWLGVGIPTREEMEEIEISCRLYAENGAYFMTATLPAQTDGDHPVMSPVTFVLAGDRLVTVRYHEPRAFQTFPLRAEKVPTRLHQRRDHPDRAARGDRRPPGRRSGAGEPRGHRRSRSDIFHPDRERRRPSATAISSSSCAGSAARRIWSPTIQDSLLTLQRLSGFLAQRRRCTARTSKDVRARVKTLSRDVLSLTDHATFLSQKITFLLDATLGMINIEQNAIIKIVSVAAVVFLPPTLVASIYGMNFDIMPELKWLLGYPFALGLMVVSAVLPFWYFRRKGWL